MVRMRRGELTLTERARRAQLIEVTVELVAAKGFAKTSLSGIADRAGITKAAVLYHFPSKHALVRAAHEHVLAALVGQVAAAVGASVPEARPAAYIRAMIRYFRERPEHTRMIIEAMTNDDSEYDSADRWRPLADLIDEARRSAGTAGPPREPAGTAPATREDSRMLAIIVGGGIDAIVAEQLGDRDFDSEAAAEQLIALLEPVIAA